MGSTINRSWHERLEEYASSHRHPVNRICHTIGIPLVAASVALVPLALLFRFSWVWIAALFVLGWCFQFLGHAFERKPPEFFKGARFLLVGVHWWLLEMHSRIWKKRVGD